MTDPSGNYSGWKATCIGQNNQAGKSLLKSDYEEGMTMSAAMKLAVKVLIKSMDSTSASADKLEFCFLTKEGDEVKQRIVPEAEVAKVIEEVQAEQKAEGDV
mmetsp:Transcript_38973/g.87144  ORF Transcript_38973/g.87144 Transcript_38973/m.87144 type:complete len:102 (+) Transcript_38973:642-947(+)